MKILYLITISFLFYLNLSFAESIWQTTNGPLGAYINCALIVPPNGNFYVGTDNQGLLKSTDAGETWISLLDEIQADNIYSLALDSSGCIYASTDIGLFKNCGSEWIQIYQNSVKSLAIYPDGTIFIGIGYNTGLIKSTDGGNSWIDCNFDTGTNSITTLFFATNGDIYTAADGYPTSSIYYSSDKGITWDKMGAIMGIQPSIAVNSSGQVLAGSSWGLYRCQMPYSKWDTLAIDYGFPLTLTVNNNDEFVGCFADYRTYKSSDNGDNWELLSENKLNGLRGGIKQDKNGNFYCACYGYGIKIYNRFNKQWALFGNNISRINVLSINTDNKDLLIAGTDKLGIYTSTNEGNNWQLSLPDIEPYIGRVYCSPSGRIYASAYFTGQVTNANCYYTDNKGLNWEKISFFEYNKVSDFIELSSGKILVSSAKGVFSSIDNGETWQESQTGLDSVLVSRFVKNDAGEIFAGTSGKGIYRSTDEGVIWECVNTSAIDSMMIRSIAIGPDGTIIAGPLCGGVYVSHDNGTNWQKIANGYTGTFPQIIDFDDSGNSYILDFYKGVFKSTDNGDSWILFKASEGTEEAVLTGVLYQGKTFFVSLPYKGGIFKTDLETTAVETIPNQATITVFPNPATNKINIIFDKACDGIDMENEIEIISIIGKAVPCGYWKKLTENCLDISKLNTGFYFLKINNRIFTFIKI